MTARAGAAFELGPFTIEPVRVTHSITEATALAIKSDAGTVLHTGDFKLDPTPPDGELTDVERLMSLGDEGISLLLSDSTNVDSPGRAASERDVGDHLAELVAGAPQRVVLGLFASNVQRLRLAVGRGGDRCNKQAAASCLLGRSIQSHVRAAGALSGKLAWPSDLVVPTELAASTPARQASSSSRAARRPERTELRAHAALAGRAPGAAPPAG